MTDLIETPSEFRCTCAGCVSGKTYHVDGLAEGASIDPMAGGTFNNKPIWDLDQIEANLNRTGYDWYTNNYGELDDGVLNYGFWKNYEELANSYYVNETGTVAFNEAYYADDFSVFNAGQIEITRETIRLWDDLIDIRFKETKSGDADLAYGNTYTGGAQAYAYLPFGDILDEQYSAIYDFSNTGRQSGDVWIDGFVGSNFFPLDDSYYAKTTMIHETGHALGLSHPGDYDALDDNDGDGQPDPITYANDAAFAQDSLQYSIMSYFDAYETGANHIDWKLLRFGYAATPLVHDVAAIQAIYGADMTTRTGATTYGFNSNAGRAELDFSLNTIPIVTIWDAGGKDTLDFSGWNTNSIINLNEGAFSSGGGVAEFQTLEEVNAARAAAGLAPRTQEAFDFYESLKAQFGFTNGLLTDNISIAYGVTIENAVGGGGDDMIIVNSAANLVNGNDGSDTVSYETSQQRVVVSLETGIGKAGASGDRLTSIENLVGSSLNDALTGSSGDNRLEGGAGDDVLVGNGGGDVFVFHTADGRTGKDRISDFGADDVIATDKALTGGTSDGFFALRGSGALILDTDGDRVFIDGPDQRGVRFLGEADGMFYYGAAANRPLNAFTTRVVEGLIGDEDVTGRDDNTVTDVFFYDTAAATPGAGDDTLELDMSDVFVTTTRLADGEAGSVVDLDGALELSGSGGSVAFSDNGSALTGLEFDGVIVNDGIEYFVYSQVGSAAGVADVVFGNIS